MYKRPDSDGVDGAVLIKPERPAVGANAGGYFSALITRNRAPTKCTAAFLNEIIEEARNLADAAGVLWKTRPDDRRNLLLSVQAIAAAESVGFTWGNAAPVVADLEGKRDGHLWRFGCDEWRVRVLSNGGRVWAQTRGASTIYTDNQNRAANSVRTLDAGFSWNQFCDLEFRLESPSNEGDQIKRVTVKTLNANVPLYGDVGLARFSIGRQAPSSGHAENNRFRVLENSHNNIYVSEIVGIY